PIVNIRDGRAIDQIVPGSDILRILAVQNQQIHRSLQMQVITRAITPHADEGVSREAQAGLRQVMTNCSMRRCSPCIVQETRSTVTSAKSLKSSSILSRFRNRQNPLPAIGPSLISVNP